MLKDDFFRYTQKMKEIVIKNPALLICISFLFI